jgi:hypothetical protein
MSTALSVRKSEPVLSKRPLAWSGLAAVVVCAASCSLPLLAIALGGGAVAAAIASITIPGAEFIAGGVAFVVALGVMALRTRLRSRPSGKMSSREQTDTAVACKPAGIPAELKHRWMEVGKQICGAVEELQELPDGYACRLPGDAATLVRAAEYVTLDRLCCTFVRWELTAEPNGGPLWMRITGPAGTKELARSVFETTDLINERVLQAAGLRLLDRRTPEQAEEQTSDS